MHGAMYDAINSIDPGHQTYRFPVTATQAASKEAAAATAGHGVLVGLVPAQKAHFDTALSASLAKVADGPAKTDGIAVGNQSASPTFSRNGTHRGSPCSPRRFGKARTMLMPASRWARARSSQAKA